MKKPSPDDWKKLYDDAWDTNNLKVTRVRLGNKYGWVATKDGHVIVPPIYDDAWDTNDPKVMWVRLGKKWGLVAVDGRVIAEPIWDNIYETNNWKVLKVRLVDKYGFYSINLEAIMGKFEFDKIEDTACPYLWQVFKDKKWGIYDPLLDTYVFPLKEIQ